VFFEKIMHLLVHYYFVYLEPSHELLDLIPVEFWFFQFNLFLMNRLYSLQN